MADAPRPAPAPDAITARFWQAAREGRLELQRCAGCGATIFYPRIVCPTCLSEELTWIEAAGEGTVYSFTVTHRAPTPAFKDRVPYVVALVDLPEGVRLLTNIVGCDPDGVRIGQPVRVTFEAIGDQASLPQFEPVE